MRLIYIAFILLAALIASAQCQQTAEDLIDQADQLSKQHRYAEADEALENAIEECDKAIEKDLNDTRAWYNKGIALDKLADSDEALAAFNEAITLNSTFVEAWIGKGEILSLIGKYDEAIKCYDKAIILDPNNIDAWNSKGWALYSKGWHNASIQAYDKVLSLDPANDYAITFKNHALYSQQENDRAIVECNKKIEKDPTNAKAWAHKGNVLRDQGEYNKSIEAYDEAIRLDPSYAEPWNGKGNIFYDWGKLDDAIKCYNEATGRDSTDIVGWINKASILRYTGKYNDTIQCYDEIIKLDPDEYVKAEILYKKGMVLYDQGKRDEALIAVEEAISLNYNFRDNWNELLANETINLLDNAISINPNNTSAWINKGAVLQKLHKFDDAIICYNEAIKLDPNNISIWFEKAHAILVGKASMSLKGYRRQNATDVYDEANDIFHPNATIWIKEGHAISYYSCEESIRCFDRAIEILGKSSNNATAWNNKGVVLTYQADIDAQRYLGEEDIEKRVAHELYRTDKREQALECFKEAIELNPECWACWYNEGVILYAINFDQLYENYEEIDGCFKAARAFQGNETNCLLVNDKWDAEYQTTIKLFELRQTSRDVERVAKYT